MEGGRRKRKLQHNNDKEQQKQDEEQEEDEKLKLFFALIQNTKSMSDRIKSKESAPHNHQHKSKGVWNPKFQPEDFIEDCDKKSNTTPRFAASCSAKQSSNREDEEQGKDKVEGNKDLDLNLSL